MPDWKAEIRRRIAPLKLAPARESEIADELSQHLDDRYQELLASGQSEDAAFRAALDELEGEDLLARGLKPVEKGSCREPIAPGTASNNFFSDILQDIRYALRMLRKSPGFTTVAVLTLALGIGANTAILTVMKAVLRPALPYPHPEQIVNVYGRNLKVLSDYAELVSIPLWRDWREQNHSFEGMAAFSFSQYFNLSGAGEAARVRAAKVSPNIFSVLGLDPVLGRGFRDGEAAPGRDHVVLLSNRLWMRQFNGRPGIIGQTVHLSRENYTVVGVLPANFQLSVLRNSADLLMPLDLTGPDSARRDLRSVIPVGRLKPGVSPAAAEVELSTITAQAAKQYPASDGGWSANVISLRDDLVPFGSSRLYVFLGLALVVLLVACLNIAVLSAAQAENRKQEFAVRAVLGASRARLLRQVLSESGVLSLLGAVAALFVARWGTSLLMLNAPQGVFENAHPAPSGFSVLAATAGMSVCTMLIVGLLPAMSIFSTALDRPLERGGSRVAQSQRAYTFFVGIELALGLALVVGAAVLARSLHAISNLDAGFDPRDVVSARVSLDPAAYPSNASRVAFFDRFVADLSGRPGVSVSAGSALPLSDAGWLDNVVSMPGAKPAAASSSDMPTCFSAFVYPGYFATLRTSVIRGRDFKENEKDAVVIINEAFARKFFPGENPIGKPVLFLPNINAAYNGASKGVRRVIGVVGDSRDFVLRYNTATFPTAFFSYAQNPTASLDVIVRSPRRDAAALLRSEAARLDPSEPLYEVQSMPEQWQRAMASWQFQSWFAGIGAVLALLLSAIGIYGVVSHSVKRRTREIGIRKALGGQNTQIIRAMVRPVSYAIALGVVGGLLTALALTRNLASLLFAVSPFDPASFLTGALLLAAVAVVACYIPARRAMKVDPMVALRYE